jgi:monofunctional biosynthetic peptidoglycan transglycosylase
VRAVKKKRRRQLVLALAALALPGILGAWVVLGLPSRSEVRALAEKRPGETALMRQRAREAHTAGRSAPVVQTWVPLSRVSSQLLHAVLASEDQRFFGHEGVDWDALRESMESNVERRRMWRGGSTLTQQLVKNLFFGTEKTAVRKLREMVVAHWMESDLTKFRILELYVNVIEWGDGVYGSEAAAHHWYHRSAAELTTEQSAGLAAMIPNPRRINPRANPRWFEKARGRVLGLMKHSPSLGRDVGGLGATAPAEVQALPAARSVSMTAPASAPPGGSDDPPPPDIP